MDEIVDSTIWSMTEWVCKRKEFKQVTLEILIDRGEQLYKGVGM